MRKFEKAEIEKRIKHAADDPRHRRACSHRKPRQLSGGQRQRVALGRAIVRDPEVFLFDEPLSNLDAKLRVQMRVELKKLHERLATTAIYVTHDQVEAMTLGDRVVVMKDGVVQQVGEPLELYNTPANRFVAGFIGSPAMNFADVTLADNGGQLVAEAPGLRIGLPDALAARARAKVGRKADARHPARGHPRRGRRRFGRPLLRRQRRGGRAARLGDPARHARRPGADGGERRARRCKVRAHDKLQAGAQSRAPAPVRRQDRSGDLAYRRCLGPAQPSSTSHLALRCSSRDFLKSWPNGALSNEP